MDFKDDSFTSFMPEHLLKILTALEKDVTHQPWKLIRNSGSFTLIINFPTNGDDKGKRKPSKERASGLKSDDSIRTRNITILPVSGLQNNRSERRRKPQQVIVLGGRLTEKI